MSPLVVVDWPTKRTSVTEHSRWDCEARVAMASTAFSRGVYWQVYSPVAAPRMQLKAVGFSPPVRERSRKAPGPSLQPTSYRMRPALVSPT
jgi:hypothetical protein